MPAASEDGEGEGTRSPAEEQIENPSSYSPSSQRSLGIADALRRQYAQRAVSSEMLLFGLTQEVDNVVIQVLRLLGTRDPEQDLAETFGWRGTLTKRAAFPKHFTPNARTILRVAAELAARDGAAPDLRSPPVIRNRHIVRGMLRTPRSRAGAWIRQRVEPHIPVGALDELVGRWPLDLDFQPAMLKSQLGSLGWRPSELEPAAAARVEVRGGDLVADELCDLIVLPCSTAGTVSDWVNRIIKTRILEAPRGGMALGEVSSVQLQDGRAYVYAASVHGDGSDARSIELIGRQLGALSERYPKIGAPLLGAGLNQAGAPRIDFRTSFEELRRGFEASAARGATLVVIVPEHDRYEALRQTHEATSAVVMVAPSAAVARRTTDVLAGFASDASAGRDLVGIEQDVNMLCSIIAARDVSPPLSIGLFGDWGTGKSFFIGKMKERLNALAVAAKSVPRSEEPAAYCGHITQLEFNAWHYIDTDNLWASLAESIIDGLARQLQSTESSVEKCARLMAAATQSRNVLAEAEQKRVEAQNILSAQQEWLARLRLERLKPVSRSELRREATRMLVETNEQARGELGKVAHDLGVEARTLEEKADLMQLRGVIRWGRAIVRSIRNGTVVTAAKAAVWAFVTALFFAAAGWFLRETIGHVATYLTAAGAWLFTQLTPLAAKLKGPVRAFIRVRDSYEANVANIEGDLLEERDKAQTKFDLAELRVKDAKQELAAIEAQIDALRADKLMAQYIRDRHGSDDYRKHLGVIARARADFEQLSRLLVDARSQQTSEGDALPRVDRIVLYIDDLDRCDERQVVSVLQAVHLLLAFELFVVVVAVDSRWLLHSLRQQSKALAAEVAHADSAEDETHWRATPMNYLEKIFQIPFALRPMNEDAFGRIVGALMPEPFSETVTSPADPPPEQTSPAAAPAAAAKSVEGAAAATAGAIVRPAEDEAPPQPTQASPNAIDPRPAQLSVHAHEVAYMKNLGRLIDSPRAAKRFINLYRLLRASVSAKQLSTFADDAQAGEYRAAMLLLAIAVGSPNEFTSLRRALCDAPDDQTWWSWFASFRDDERRREAPQTLARDSRMRLDELERDLEAVREQLGPLPPCSIFREWGVRVARFSFNAGTAAEHEATAAAVSRRSLGSGHAST